MIKLSDGCYVTPDEIESIRVGAFGLWVRTKDGIGHCHELTQATELLSKIGPEWELRLVPRPCATNPLTERERPFHAPQTGDE